MQAHLAAGGSPDLKYAGIPALIEAAYWKRLGMVRMLITAGANLELVDENNHTALMEGAQVGCLEVVEELLRAGANSLHKTDEGLCAAALARQEGHEQVAALLEEVAASPHRPVCDSIAAANAAWPKIQRVLQLGLADEELPAGTRLQVEPHGEGTYERWRKNRIGANDHFVRFASGVERVQLKKLGATAWHIVSVEVASAETRELSAARASLGEARAAGGAVFCCAGRPNSHPR